MAEIKLSKGEITLVDDADFEFLNQFRWYANRGYATRTTDKALMHKLIMGVPKLVKGDKRIEVDHEDTSKLNNQRSNLRLVTSSQNKMNSPLRKDSTTGYKGVSLDKAGRGFETYIWVNKKKRFLGYFDTAVKAAKAYNEAAKEHFGEFARLNEIRGGVSSAQ